MRLPVNHALTLTALLLTAGIGQAYARPPATPAAPAATGPAADYPVVVGAPYTIGSTTWTPADQLNYDAVGYARVGDGLIGVTAAHKTLPLPSYAEITALDTGRTILVRVVERGPQDNDTLVALSTAAASQLGLAPGARSAIRVRRVNPPEVERAGLRMGGTAPMRMETPESLLKVLRRKLAEQSPLMPPPSVPPKMPSSLEANRPVPPSPELPPPSPVRRSAPVTKPTSKPTVSAPIAGSQTASAAPTKREAAPRHSTSMAPPASQRPAPTGTHVIQVAAFSTQDRATKVAHQLGGAVSAAGKVWRVRLGPFSGSGEAASALEKAKAAGYRDARIQRAD